MSSYKGICVSVCRSPDFCLAFLPWRHTQPTLYCSCCASCRLASTVKICNIQHWINFSCLPNDSNRVLAKGLAELSFMYKCLSSFRVHFDDKTMLNNSFVRSAVRALCILAAPAYKSHTESGWYLLKSHARAFYLLYILCCMSLPCLSIKIYIKICEAQK